MDLTQCEKGEKKKRMEEERQASLIQMGMECVKDSRWMRMQLRGRRLDRRREGETEVQHVGGMQAHWL